METMTETTERRRRKRPRTPIEQLQRAADSIFKVQRHLGRLMRRAELGQLSEDEQEVIRELELGCRGTMGQVDLVAQQAKRGPLVVDRPAPAPVPPPIAPAPEPPPPIAPAPEPPPPIAPAPQPPEGRSDQDGVDDVDEPKEEELPPVSSKMAPTVWPIEDAMRMWQMLGPANDEEAPAPSGCQPAYPELVKDALDQMVEKPKPRSKTREELIREEEEAERECNARLNAGYEKWMRQRAGLPEPEPELPVQSEAQSKEPPAPPEPSAAEPKTEPDLPVPRPLPELPLPCTLPRDEDLPEHEPLRRIAVIAGADGKKGLPRQFGLIGKHAISQKLVALCTAGCLAIAHFGANNTGKSYAMAVMLEIFLRQFGRLNVLKHPLCGLFFHTHRNNSYLPEMLSAVFPNLQPDQAQGLAKEYETLPSGLPDVMLLTLSSQLAKLQQQYPHVTVQLIRFSLRELGLDGLRLLLGLNGSSPLYARKIEVEIKALIKQDALTWDNLVKRLILVDFDKAERRRLSERLSLVRPFIDDSVTLGGLVQPGRLIILDVSDAWEEQDQVMMLSAILTRVFCMGADRGKEGACPIVALYDEAHKYFAHSAMAKLLEYLVRERRHLGLNLIFGSQDPMSIPGRVIGLLDVIGLLQTDCPEWLRYLMKYNDAFKRLKVKHTHKLPAGVMWMWAKHWAVIDDEWWDPEEPFLPVAVRPRVTLHGGETRGAGAL